MELILTKRGINFREDEFKNLDLRNHKLRLRFEDRNGTIVSGDIVVGYKRVYSKKIFIKASFIKCTHF